MALFIVHGDAKQVAVTPMPPQDRPAHTGEQKQDLAARVAWVRQIAVPSLPWSWLRTWHVQGS